MSMKRAIIFSGGQLHPDFLQQIQEDDLIIGADRGALFLIEHGVHPHVAVGDFDSLTDREHDLANIKANSDQLIVYDSVEKDWSDTEAAFEIAMERHIRDVLILGALGTRFDHTLANVQLLVRAVQHQVNCSIMDMNNYISLTSTQAVIENRGFPYISLLPVTAEVTGITLTGFQYPLEQATLRMGQSRGISNHLINEDGTVSIEGGLLLIIQSRD